MNIRGTRRLACCAGVCALSFIVWVALGVLDVGGGGVATASVFPVGSPSTMALQSLVVPAVQQLDQGQQMEDARQAERNSSGAYVARLRSRTEFEHLASAQAARVTREAFPGVVDEPAGGPPKLPAGDRILKYVASNAVTVALPGGEHGTVESLEPMAKEALPGRFAPIDLGLRDAGNDYEPIVSNVAVKIPKRLSTGVQLPGDGVSITPVDARGAPLVGAAGAADGVTVLYANTQVDTDTDVKPTTAGFEIDAVLRSPKSPGKLYFRVKTPLGARLVQKSSSGAIAVLDGRKEIAVVPAPSAQDAAGVAIPVSMSVAGHTIVLAIGVTSDEYQYPVIVDPVVDDTQVKEIHNGVTYKSRWRVDTSNGHEGPFHFSEARGLRDYHEAGELPGYERGEWGGFDYETQGESAIYDVHVESSFGDEGHGFEDQAQIRNKVHTGSNESPLEIRTGAFNEEYYPGWEFCILSKCAVPSEVTSEIASNNMSLIQFASQSGNYTMNAELYSAYVAIVQTRNSTVSLDTTDKEVEGRQNALYGSEHWVNSAAAVAKGTAVDPGIGISEVAFTSSNEPSWSVSKSYPYPSSAACEGVICPREESFSGSLSGLPEGKDTLTFGGGNATDTKTTDATISTTVYIDNSAPHNVVLTGLGSGNEIGEGTRTVKVEATDGSGSTPSSGVKSIALAIDGHEIGKANGSCSPGPCTAKGEWSVNGGEYGAGEHKLTVTATDNAGNVEQEVRSLKEYRSTPVSVGPGSVAPQSGQLSLSATDVSIGAPGSSLTVGRTYRSRYLTAGTEGPLGPQWSLSIGGQESITRLPNGNATLTAANGGQSTFTTNEKGGFTSPPGDINLTLSEIKNGKGERTEYVLKDAASDTTTKFTSPSGPTGSLWRPTTQEGQLASQTVRYFYETVGNVTRPIEALAPVPLGMLCVSQVEKKETLEKGCRALTFRYATKTGAGEKESEWGEYNGRLMEVLFTAYNPTSKEMKPVPVAMYAYDGQGKLRAEWDPRVSPELKTIFGYDTEGHVTALSPPGQETWAFTYGQIAGDPSTGRLLKVTQAPISAGVWNGEEAKNTEAPKLSGAAVLGVTMGVSNGTWSNSPVAYSYQWEDCNSAGKECTPIVGAINANYKVTENDIGHTLVAAVSAANGDGTVTVASAASAKVLNTYELTEYALPEHSNPVQIALGPDKNLWFTEFAVGKIGKMTTAGVLTQYSLLDYSNPHGITAGPTGSNSVWFTLGGEIKVGQINISSDAISEYSVPSGSETTGMTAGPESDVWFTNQGTSKIGKINTSGSIKEYSLPTGSYPVGITAGPDGNAWFTDGGTSKIGKITSSGAVTEYSLPSGSDPSAITKGPDENLWFAEGGTDKIGKITTSGSITEYSLPSGSDASGITTGPNKNIWFTDSANKIGQITTSGVVTEYSLPSGSSPWGITAGPDENVWFVDAASSKVGKIKATVPTEGTRYAPGPGTTLEYGIPTSGTGLPTLTKEEVEKWGQTDDPTEGMAIFPPDEPMGWPATDYKRASFTYTDSKDKTVNTVSPSRGVSTTEYNSYNDVVRTLSPDNQATALKEGCESKTKCKSAEMSKLLDTENAYEEKGSEPGTELLSTLGPQHTVKLVSGTQVLARADKVYSYNKEAPSEGGPYHLVTKTTESALASGKEEDKRTTEILYSGQEGLGWKLRKPTSVLTDPGGLNLAHTTLYDKNTGNVIEARTPEDSGSHLPSAPVYASQFGSYGWENGQFIYPAEDAVDAAGDVWVTDHGNDRLEKFSPEGKFVAAYGSEGSGAGQFSSPGGIAVNQGAGDVYVSDGHNNRVEELTTEGKFVATFGFGVSDGKEEAEICKTSCKAGIAGSGSGQFNGPLGIAIDGSGNVWVVDHANNRLEEFSNEGKFLATYGSKGSEHGQFKEPVGVAISAGNLYVTDSGNDRVEELSKSGSYIGQFGSEGTGNGQFDYPYGIAVDPTSGVLYVGDPGNGRVEEFSETGEYRAQFGSKGSGNGQIKEAEGIAVNSAGNVYVVDTGNSRVEMWEPAPAVPVFSSQFGNTGSEIEKLSYPTGDAIDAHGDVWVASAYGNGIEEFSASGTFMHSYGSWGAEGNQFNEPVSIEINHSTGVVYVGDNHNNRVDEWNEKGEFVETFGFGVSNGKEEFEVCKSSCKAGIAGGGAGQFKEPNGVALDAKGDLWVTDYANSRLQEFSSAGAFMQAIGFGVGNGEEKFENCTSGCRAGTRGTGNGQFNGPADLIVDGGVIYVTDENNSRVEEFNEKGEYVGKFGSNGTGNGEFNLTGGIGADPSGNLYVTDILNGRVEEFTRSGTFLIAFGSKGLGNGQLSEPGDVAVGPTGTIYVADASNNRISEWTPAPRSGNEGAHDKKTIYYTAKGESEIITCQNHPEWANLPCETEPAVQPGTSGLPELPVNVTTYNVWDEPETTTETVGSAKRTKTATYDAAGRPKTMTTSSTVGTALPTVTDEYNGKTGALEKQSTTTEGKTKTITSVYNTRGQLETYTDADEGTTTYEYDIDGRIKKTNDGKGTRTFTYSETTGLPIELLDEYGTTKLKFTATYDSEGNLLTESYPNGMNAIYTYNPVDTPVGLEYKKTIDCTEEKEKCKWFTDTVVPSIHGQWLEQTSTFSHQAYIYDAAGRLTQVQNTPTGKGCTTRVYAYDEEANRTSLTTREPNAKNECATEGGTVETHSYDAANRLVDAGVVYSTFGNITNLPAADAGGSEPAELTSTYYSDNQLASQTQNGETIGYNLDPAGRAREIVSTGKKVSDVINHYMESGNAPAWTANTSGETMRNILNIRGGLAAIQSNTEAPVLQLTNLHGDIIATAYLSETATSLASQQDTSEFGVPTNNLPSKYSWLGALELPTELPSGVVEMGARSYVPQLGRFLQPDPRPGGSANAYTYTFGDPVNSLDPSGEFTWGFSESVTASLNAVGQEIVAREAAREAAARAAAEAAAREAAEEAAMVAGPQYGGEEWEEWEEYEEEGGYEYASYHRGAEAEGDDGHLESGVLLQPLHEEGEVEGETSAHGLSTKPAAYVRRVRRHQCVRGENGWGHDPTSPEEHEGKGHWGEGNSTKAWTNVWAAWAEDDIE